MLDPYRMIVINIIVSAAILFGILIFKIFYPKRSINLFILLILISLLPVISIFRQGAYESGDFNIHIYRAIEFYNSLSEGNIMPSWAGDLNATYGYPLFIFNYPLPYYIISLFHFLGFTFITSMKIFLSLTLITSGIFMYLCTKDLFKNKLAAFTSSVFYIFAPYHLIDLHFKVVIGELLSFTLLPLIFFSLNKLYNKPGILLLLTTSILFAALIMSHVVIGFFSGILILVYIILKTIKDKNIKPLFFVFCAFLIAGIMSIYAWLTPFFLSKYTFIQLTGLSTVHFPTIPELLYSPWRMGLLFQGPMGEISNLIGYTQIFVVFIMLILFLTKRGSKLVLFNLRFWLISSFIIFFLITPYSKFIWEVVPFIKATGSHRLLLLLAFSISILAGYLSILFKNKKILIYLLIILTIGSTILNWGQRRMIQNIDDNFLKANLWKSTSQGEAHFYANSKWVDIKNPWFSKLPKNHFEIISGEGKIKETIRSSTLHTYNIDAKSRLKIQESTLYFPGWKGFINGKEISVYPSSKGIIQVNIPQGYSTFEIAYQDVPIYKLLKIISVLSFAGIFILIFLR